MAKPTLAAPSFSAVGTVATGTAPITASGPTTAANDISIAIVICNSANPTTPGGWTLCPGAPIGSGPFVNLYWQRASGVGTPSFTVPSGSGASRAVIANYSGCITSGNPYDVGAGQGNASSSTVSIPAVTTTGANRLVVLAAAAFANVNGNFSNSTLSSLTTRGSSANVRFADGSLANPGSSGTSTAPLASSVVNCGFSLALRSF